MVSNEFEKGDRGGNDFPLQSKDGIKELHALWDSVLYEQTGYADLPFDDQAWEDLTQKAQNLISEYGREAEKDVSFNPQKWAEESFEISKHFVYPHITEGALPSDEYVSEGREIAFSQIVKAGYRLAYSLESFDYDFLLGAQEQDMFLQ